MFQVTVDMFSARRNPTWSITGDQAASVLGAMIRNPEIIASRPGFSGLGYRGINLTKLNEEDSSEEIPDSVWIANGGSSDEEAGLELAYQLIEQGFSEPRGVLSLDGEQIIDRQVQDLIYKELSKFQSTVAGWAEGLGAGAEQEGAGDDEAGAVGCTFEYNSYIPGWWNNNAYRRANNNCYAYACNKATNTFPQPGKAHGITPSMACSSVGPAAHADGLVVSSDCQPASAGRRYYVALVVAPGIDYHWYRKAAEGYWGHKPGNTDVINSDNSGNIIYNPYTANRGIYTDFCEWMCAPSNLVSIA